MRYKWVLFDADGTLFDYDRAEAEALRRTFRQLGCPFHKEYIRVYRGINERVWLEYEQGRITQAQLRRERFERLLETIIGVRCDMQSRVRSGARSGAGSGAYGGILDPARFSTRYLENLAQCSQLVDGAQEVVERLHGQVGLVVITNGLQDVQRPRFAHSPIRDYIHAVVISGEVGVAKPARGIFDAAFEKMGHPSKDQVLIVGDGLTSDIRGGSDYGIDTCWFNPDRRPRSPGFDIRYEIHDLRELLTIVDGHL